jgi:putative NADH-flavin reductase
VPYLEIARKILIAVKTLKTPYLIMVGGCGSLAIPAKDFETALDSEDFWIAYFQHAADSAAYITYAEQRFPKFATLLHRYRDVRQMEVDELDEEDQEFLSEMKQFAKTRINQSYFIMACRASLQFFQGNRDLLWSFISPSAGLKPGPKTGKYVIGDPILPIDGSQTPPYGGRLLGITIKDLASVIVDEVEAQKMLAKHWTVWTPNEDAVDEPLKQLYGTSDEVVKAD